MTNSRANPLLVGLAVAVHGTVTAFVWRDIGRRPASQLRGPKTFWRVVTGLNAGNSLIYLLVGRRR